MRATQMRRLAALIPLMALLITSAAADARDTRPIAPPLHTRGADVVDANGRTVVLKGVNWFGFETSNHVVHGLWSTDYRAMLAKVRRLGFNTLRIPFSIEALRSDTLTGVDVSNGRNAALQGATPLQALEIVVREAGRHGLLVLLDNHSGPDNAYTEGLWHGSRYSEDDWVATWRMLARRFGDVPNVIGADLKNEPHGEATWGTGGPTDWRRAAERAGDAVLEIAPHWLIVVEGIGGAVSGQRLDTHWWGGNLEGVRSMPVRLSRPNRLVYSPHEYGPGVFPQPWFQRGDMARVLAERWELGFGYIARQGIAPILVGEFGGRNVDLRSAEGRWQRQFLDYISRMGLSWTYWSLNPNSGDTGGVLQDDWTSVNRAKMALLSRVIARQRIAFGGGSVAPAPRRRAAPRRPVAGPRAPSGRRRGAAPRVPAGPPHTPTPTPKNPPAPGSLSAALVVENRWDGGWCGHFEVAGPDADLRGVHVSFTLAAGTRIAQQWNGTFSGDAGRVTVTLPEWARTQGGPYTATGFCVAGSGAASGVSVD
jgi:endoglucanase